MYTSHLFMLKPNHPKSIFIVFKELRPKYQQDDNLSHGNEICLEDVRSRFLQDLLA